MKFQKLIAKLGENLGKDSEDGEVMQKIILVLTEFCQTRTSTILGWFSGKSFPGGVQLVKFREVFIAAGYEFEEHTTMSANLRILAALIAHGKIDTKLDCQKLGFPNRDEILRPLSTDRPITEGRNAMLGEKLHALYAPDIANIEALRERFRILRELKATDPTIVIKPIDNFYYLEKGLYSIEFAINTLTPALEALAEGNVEERREFREKFNSTKFFKLSNTFSNFAAILNGLGSEKALEVIKNKKPKGAS